MSISTPVALCGFDVQAVNSQISSLIFILSKIELSIFKGSSELILVLGILALRDLLLPVLLPG